MKTVYAIRTDCG